MTASGGSGPLPRRTQVAVVGGGQAGLAMSWWLGQLGMDHVVLEQHDVAHDWRQRRWDSFTLVTPNWQCDLPGYPYSGPDPHGFMRRGEVVAYLESYATALAPPLHTGVSVAAVHQELDGGFAVATSAGVMRAGAVVAATGAYHHPVVPPWAGALDPTVVQLDAGDYRHPDQLPPGAVLVVGSGQSGTQIAEDLHLAGRQVHLAVGDAPRCARFHRGRDVVDWLHDMGHYDIPVTEHPLGASAGERTNHYVTGRDGGRDIDLRAFASEGMRLYGRSVGGAGTALRFAPTLRAALDGADRVYRDINRSIDRWIAERGVVAPPAPPPYEAVWAPDEDVTELDLRSAGVTSVVWAIGYRGDWSWARLPVVDAQGRPRQRRGLTGVPGFCFLGLPWMHTWGSGRFASVGRDAEHLARHLARQLSPRQVPVPA